MSELKPCPFCGGEAEIKTLVYQSRFEEKTKQVECTQCKATSNAGEHQGDLRNDEMAAKEWNQRQDGWISVNDRLPKNGERVLIFTSDVIEAVMYEQKRFNRFGRGIDYATHWQPLPHPPITSTPPIHADD